jgi:hypothetical protein
LIVFLGRASSLLQHMQTAVTSIQSLNARCRTSLRAQHARNDRVWAALENLCRTCDACLRRLEVKRRQLCGAGLGPYQDGPGAVLQSLASDFNTALNWLDANAAMLAATSKNSIALAAQQIEVGFFRFQARLSF